MFDCLHNGLRFYRGQTDMPLLDIVPYVNNEKTKNCMYITILEKIEQKFSDHRYSLERKEQLEMSLCLLSHLLSSKIPNHRIN